MPNAAIMLCAGRATRMRGAVADKVLAPLARRPVLEYSLRAFLAAKVAGEFVFVTRDDKQAAAISTIFTKIAGKRATAWFVPGGAERQDSVWNGLSVLGPNINVVFIHDCARPLVASENLRALLAAARADGAAVLAHRVTDTIKQTHPGVSNLRRIALRDLRRDTLWAMETPQVFSRELITRAYAAVRRRKLRVTDDAAAAALLRHPVTLVENTSPNLKLTHPADMAYAALLLK